MVRYESHNRMRKGVCSSYLIERVKVSDSIPVFVHVARHFHLPEDEDALIIMVGPGTGVAPFRAFLQEREVTGARGGNWLFFGEQRQTCDFFYKDEWNRLLTSGLLTRIDMAFSRDQAAKVYVQHRMIERADDLWEWLERGAYIYVCGDANHMAKDVDATLHLIAQKAGGLNEQQAAAFIDGLRKMKKYRRDVY